MASITNTWAPYNYRPKSVINFVVTSLIIHALLVVVAYKTGVFSNEDINSIPTRTISISIVEPTRIVTPPPVIQPKPKPVERRKIVTQASSPKVVNTTPLPVKKDKTPQLPKIEKKAAASPLPSPVSKAAVFSSPQPSYQPKPKYPAIARRRGVEGSVIFEISVANDGHVTNAIMIESSGSAALDRSAAKAIKTWLFPASQFNSLSSFKQRIEFRLNHYY
ncbi:MAG: energy transducer TonB [Porticoccaceae bacterium]|nr:energy transducer TonB [Porticoccaceae bacterium]